MILVIAIIFVCAVSVELIVGAGMGLRERTYKVKREVETDLTGGIQFMLISATDPSEDSPTNPGMIENFQVTLRTKPGSGSLNFNHTVFMLDTDHEHSSFRYGGIVNSQYDEPDDNSTYQIYYMSRGHEWNEGYLGRGDVVRLKFNNTFSIRGSTMVRLTVVQQEAAVTRLDFLAPKIMTRNRETMYPPLKI